MQTSKRSLWYAQGPRKNRNKCNVNRESTQKLKPTIPTKSHTTSTCHLLRNKQGPKQHLRPKIKASETINLRFAQSSNCLEEVIKSLQFIQNCFFLCQFAAAVTSPLQVNY
ncbi:hypothetical protein H5410_059814 [Solanum commersonii]|uniref:Uncharacterized protein n=1 Tax=Solanum commersonii TaxID=4109 RepID=A0A9J5W434_SOLCO|nr:hypothetical protein H5410_059814 [Solanum commersonii]